MSAWRGVRCRPLQGLCRHECMQAGALSRKRAWLKSGMQTMALKTSV